MLLVTRVAGDGDCLFHALGLPDSYDGNALRIEVADFMEARAPGLPAADQQLWLLEAEKLRGNRWAGHTAAVAYSAFKQRRVLIHQRREGAAPRVEDATHASVPPTAPLQHILYNGADHYDALVEVSTAEGLVPAWEQPLPPAYFEHPNAVPFAAGSFPALASSRARQPKRPAPNSLPRGPQRRPRRPRPKPPEPPRRRLQRSQSSPQRQSLLAAPTTRKWGKRKRSAAPISSSTTWPPFLWRRPLPTRTDGRRTSSRTGGAKARQLYAIPYSLL